MTLKKYIDGDFLSDRHAAIYLNALYSIYFNDKAQWERIGWRKYRFTVGNNISITHKVRTFRHYRKLLTRLLMETL